MPTLVIRHPDGSEQEQDLANQLTIGRADGNDLVLVEGGVSRKHARIFSQGADVMIEDTGSANGTFVDGEKIAGPTKLSARAQVVIGDYEIVLKGAGKASGKPASRPPPGNGKGSVEPTSAVAPVKAARATKVVPAVKGAPASKAALATRPKPGGGAAGGPALRGLTGPWMNKSFPLKGTMVVGRVAGVDIQLEDDSVSRRHAELEVKGREVVLRDLGSANGTAVNGGPVSEDQVLKTGDIIQFGVVEMSFEGPAAGALARVQAGSAAKRPGRPSKDPELDEFPPEITGTGTGLDPRKKKLMIGGGALAGLILIGVTVKALQPEEPINPPLAPRPGMGQQQKLTPDEYLANCRQFASADMAEPNWDKATEACNEVLKDNPIHPEALSLLRRIEVERQCEVFFNKGKKLMQRNREEDAVDELAKIKSECTTYYSKGKQLVKEAAEKVKKKSGEDCRNYSGNGQWKEALPRCQKYMEYACQDMQAEDLYPPATMTMSISGPLKKNMWRPKDPMYLKFLTAREKEDPGAPAWKCIEMPMLQKEKSGPSPSAYAEAWFKKRIDDQEIQLTLKLYFDGKFREAVTRLQKMRDQREKAKYHAMVDNLAKDMSNVSGLYNEGQTELSGDKPEHAEEPFREALDLDARILLGEEKMKLPEAERKKELDRMQSWFRKSINYEMAQKCFERGTGIFERQDPRGACKVWKVGYSFYRGNTDLLKAVAEVCTANASQAFAGANSCEDLKLVLEWAIDGDGFKEKAEAKMAELACPAPGQQ
jgi:ABC transport system ATP-binding/permease protein